MSNKPHRTKRLGAQLWVERDDDADRIDRLLAAMKEDGLELARVFLLWVYVEERPDKWRWELYDSVFDAAARHGIGIKATLCANSGPAHVGFPLQLHTHTSFLETSDREAAARYIEKCVARYRDHAALDQWVLWNEPFIELPGPRSGLFNAFFREYCRKKFSGDIGKLNRAFLTDYKAFDEIPDFRDIPHPAHSWQSGWVAYPFAIALRHAMADWLTAQVQWIADRVRAIDATTPLCVNPVTIHCNHASGGTKLGEMAAVVDVLGASFHAPWHWAEYDPASYPGLVSQGLKRITSTKARAVEITEMPFGAQGYCSRRPMRLPPATLAQTILAGFASGAGSTTGWAYNCRRQNFEAGDWSLCNEDDTPSERNAMIRKIRCVLDTLGDEIGPWEPRAPTVLALNSFEASVIEDIDGSAVDRSKGKVDPDAGLTANDAYPGAAFLAIEAQKRGLAASVAELRDFLDRPEAFTEVETVFACQLTAIEENDMQGLLAWAERGGRLVVDAMTGRKNTDAELHVPWPTGFQALGLKVQGIQPDLAGWAVVESGLAAGRWSGVRSTISCTDGAWRTFTNLRFEQDGSPLALRRSWGKGQVVFVRGQFAATMKKLACQEQTAPGVARLCDEIFLKPDPPAIVPRHGPRGVIVIPVHGENADAWFVLAPPADDRSGVPLHLGCAGVWKDFWGGGVLRAVNAEVTLTAEDGVAILVPVPPDQSDRETWRARQR